MIKTNFSFQNHIAQFFSFFSFILFFSFISSSYAQNNSVAIGSEDVKENAVLWLNGNGNQGLLLPAVAAVGDIISPDAGMIVFQTSDNKVYYRNATDWIELGAEGNGSSDSYSLDINTNSIQLLKNGDIEGAAIGLDAVEIGASSGDIGGTIESPQIKDGAVGLIQLDNMGLGSGDAGNILRWNGTLWEAVANSGGAGTDDQAANEVSVTAQNGVTSTDTQAALEELQGEITTNTSSIVTNATAIAADLDSDATNEIQDAAGVAVSPSGNLTATNVQAALVELQTDLDASAGNDDQAANEVPVTAQNGVTSTDTQAALEELQGEITTNTSSIATNATAIAADLDSDATNEIQDATGVAVTPAGNLTATNVQAALVELQTDLDASGGTDDQVASEVPIIASVNLRATDAQGAFDELQGDIDVINAAILGTGDMQAATYDANSNNIVDASETAATVTTNANLTGPVTSTGNATSIANGAITNAMLANGDVANLSGTNSGDESVFTLSTDGLVPAPVTTSGRVLQDDGTWVAAGSGDMLQATYDGNTDNIVDMAATVTTNADLTGPVTSIGNATAIGAGVITNAMLANGDVANLSGTNTGDQTNVTGNAATVTTNANLTGPVTSTGNATAIGAGVITNAMLANGDVANLSGTNTGDQTITLTGDVTGSGTGSFATTLATVPITKGGTGATTAGAALTNLGGVSNPMTTSGDIIVGGAAGVVTRLAAPGTNRAILGYNGTNQVWVTGTANQVIGTNGTGDLTSINQSAIGDQTGLADNAIPRALGGTLVPSIIADDGTNVGIGVAAQATSKLSLFSSDIANENALNITMNTSAAGVVIANRTGLTATGSGQNYAGSFVVVSNNGSSTRGVAGQSSSTSNGDHYGVTGISDGTNTGFNYGVFGRATGAAVNYAGYFAGNTVIEGELAVGATPSAGTSGQVLQSNGANAAPSWVAVSGGGWGLTGNAGTVDDGTNFIGTIDDVPLNFKVNNQVAGRIDNTLGNTFFGVSTGLANVTGFDNVAIGTNALLQSLSRSNTAIGSGALQAITSNGENTAVGNFALGNSTGGGNTAVGRSALDANVAGTENTAIGFGANVGSGGLTNATAIGTNARVDQSNSLILGSINGVNGATSAVNVGIGTTTPEATLHIVGGSALALRLQSATHVFMELYAEGAGTRSGWFGYGIPSDPILAIRNERAGGDIILQTEVGGVVHIAGAIKIADGSEAAGRVLTSDATGLATWQTAASSPFTQGAGVVYNNSTDQVVIGNTSLTAGYKFEVETPVDATMPIAISADQNYTGAAQTFGFISQISNAGTGQKSGIWNIVAGNVAQTQDIIGTRNQMTKGSTENVYGIYNTGEDYNYFEGNVGIGTTTPTYPLTVLTSTNTHAIVGTSTFVNAGVNYGVDGKSSGGDFNWGVSGRGTGGTQAIGIYGVGTGGMNSSYGLYGIGSSSTASNEVAGVYGLSDGATIATATYGGKFEAKSIGGSNTNYGIYATASGANTNYAGYFDGDVETTANIVASGEYKYAAPKQKYQSIPAASFTLANHTGGVSDIFLAGDAAGTYRYTNSFNTTIKSYMMAPIVLPDGATIKAVDLYMRDDDGAYTPFYELKRVTLASPGSGVVLGTSPGASEGADIALTINGLSEVVDNSQYAYYILIQSAFRNSAITKYYGARITYDVSRVD